MIKKPSLTSSQLLFMSVGSAIVFPYTFMPILSAPPKNQDAWFVMIVALIYIFILSIPLLILMNKFRGVSFNTCIEIILGRVIGKAAAVVFALFFIYCFTACMLISALYITLYIFPETPMWALLLYIIIPVAYASYKGPGTIGRLAFFIVPFIMLTIILFFLLGLKGSSLSELKPVLADSTFWEINQGAFLTGARYSEILIFLIFSYYLNKKYNINKTFASALLVFGASFFLVLFPVLTHLGPELAKHTWNPYLVYTRHVKGYDFIERVQALNTLAWFPAVLLKLTLYNNMACFVLSNAMRAKSHKGFVLPISITGALICLIPILNKSSTVEFLRSDQVFPYIVIPVTFILPLILLIIYVFRRKRINERLEEKKRYESEPEA